MSGIRKDEFGFMRSSGYGRINLDHVRKELGAEGDEVIYHTSNKGGVRSSKVVDGKDVDYKPGDTFNAGPQIVKAALFNLLGQGNSSLRKSRSQAPSAVGPMAQLLKTEMAALKRAGYGAVTSPQPESWGESLRLKGMPLPGGTRTDAMILLPKNYPYTSPIGFYLKKGAALGGLDMEHLYNNAYHGAIDLTAQGWQWFCGIAEGWKPGKHNLVTYLSMVQTMLAERSA